MEAAHHSFLHPLNLSADADDVTLIIGGCHVGGQAVGEVDAFPAHLQKAGMPLANTECLVVAGVSVMIAERRVRELLVTRTISRVILQVGHRETIRSSRLRLPWRRTPAAGNSPTPSGSDTRLSIGSYIWTLMVGSILYRLGVDRWTEPRTLLERRLGTDLPALLRTLRRGGVTDIILLSCFPSAKKRLNNRRLIANGLIEQAAHTAGAMFIDVWSALSFRSGPLRDFAKPQTLADAAHLSAEGHQVVARVIASLLPQQRFVPRSFKRMVDVPHSFPGPLENRSFAG